MIEQVGEPTIQNDPNAQVTIANLQGAAYNPREISKHDFAALKRSIKEFGDLSGIVRNRTTNNLVGGHQRLAAFRELPNPTIVIEETLASPNSVGTVARGHVLLGDEKYTYREVQWDIQREMTANVAANRIQGQFDQEKLANVIAEINAEFRELTGNTDKEIDKLLQMSSSPEIALANDAKPGFQQMTFTLSDAQAEVLNAAVKASQDSHDFSAEDNKNSNGNALWAIAHEWLNERSKAN